MSVYDDVDAGHGHNLEIERGELADFAAGPPKPKWRNCAIVGFGFVAAVAVLVLILQFVPDWALNAFVWMFGA